MLALSGVRAALRQCARSSLIGAWRTALVGCRCAASAAAAGHPPDSGKKPADYSGATQTGAAKQKPTASGTSDEKHVLEYNLMTPHTTIVSRKQVNLVTVPGALGYLGIMAGHVPYLSELHPGLVTAQAVTGETAKYFISGGMLYVDGQNTCDIHAPEAVELSAVDPEALKAELEKAEKMRQASLSQEDHAKAHITCQLYEALTWALKGYS